MTNNPIMMGDGQFHELPQAQLEMYEHLRDITLAEIDAEWEEYRRLALENEK